jgi:rubrerythrin
MEETKATGRETIEELDRFNCGWGFPKVDRHEVCPVCGEPKSKEDA